MQIFYEVDCLRLLTVFCCLSKFSVLKYDTIVLKFIICLELVKGK
jgi:hypothetical protein